MLKNYWYAVHFGSAVGSDPVAVKALGEDLVLWRNENDEIVAQSDLCIHRGGPLSLGDMVTADDGSKCVRCPYHGWEYDSDGVCTKIPANRGDLKIPRKARVDTYPCVERYGFVFVFLGDLPHGDRPPLPELLDMEPVAAPVSEGRRAIQGEFRWAANFERVIENGADIAHAPFVHRTSFGNPDKPEVADHEVEETWVGDHLAMILAAVELEAPNPSGIWGRLKGNKVRPRIPTKVGVYFPNVSLLEVNTPIGQIRIYTAHVPVDEDTTISRWIMIRDFFKDGPRLWQAYTDKDSYRRTMKIFYEDQATVEGQRPELVPFDLSAELHIKSDAVSLAYRRWRQAGIDRGWAIEPHQIRTSDDKRTYTVIPSPARRDNPELANAWIAKEIETRSAIPADPSVADPAATDPAATDPAADVQEQPTEETTRG